MAYNIDKGFTMLIPKDSPITVLLIWEAHAKNLHGGPQLTLFCLRQTIWIPGGLSAVEKNIYNCNPYIRHEAGILQPQMGDLPGERVVSSFAPTHTSLDYYGPFSTKDSSTGQQINWLTIPPRSPHFAGVWEAAIKSITRHFNRTVGTKKMSFDICKTLITQIEAILHSCTLTAPFFLARCHPLVLLLDAH